MNLFLIKWIIAVMLLPLKHITKFMILYFTLHCITHYNAGGYLHWVLPKYDCSISICISENHVCTLLLKLLCKTPNSNFCHTKLTLTKQPLSIIFMIILYKCSNNIAILLTSIPGLISSSIQDVDQPETQTKQCTNATNLLNKCLAHIK